jgi:hypothetical protein
LDSLEKLNALSKSGVADPDPLFSFWKLDPDVLQSEKLDPDQP